ncbi:hypothetical protein DFH09DRAFT_109489 [Mycena vulgaris]|nr:hypothetical protein DFH09DRAFT_109489 [Mycena vulgaris]
MGIEQRRKQLMAQQPAWGDSPSPPQLSSSQNGSDRESHQINDSPPQLVATRDDVLGLLDALIMADPQTRPRRASLMGKPAMLSCKGWTLEALVRKSKNFSQVPRVQWSLDASTSAQIRAHEVANPGVPLVVEGLHNHPGWMKDKFTPRWLEQNGPKSISARNVCDRTDKNIKLSDFIARTRATSPFATPGESERLYGKDVPCPPEWNTFLHSAGVVPHFLSPDGPDNLLNNLPKPDQPETLMCYLGVGDTFTPCHKDLCASSGHNLMCYTENGGSSFWFMTASSSANAAAEYFHKKLKQDLDHETHVITVEELARAPFEVYITEQKLGDLVLVPPRSSHQVVNAGGITIKTSWSRMTLDGLSLALRYELPLYRRVCRSEIYRVKSTIYHTLRRTTQTVSNLLRSQVDNAGAMATTSQMTMETHLVILRRALLLFDSILVEDYSQEHHKMRKLGTSSEPDGDSEVGQFTCDFCGCDVFQSFFECRSCVGGGKAHPGAGFMLCPGCYVEGRTCHCEVMSPMQCRPFDKLLQTRARGAELFTEAMRTSRARGPAVPSIEEVLRNDKLGLFRAALVLRKRRVRKDTLFRRPSITSEQEQKSERRCIVRTGTDLNHHAPNAWVLPCKKCHSGTCMAHIIWERQLHSAEALLIHDKDESHAEFHELHKVSKSRFDAELAALKLEQLDRVPDLRVQLAYLATTFSTCRPINPNRNLWKVGYYDLTVWETSLPDDETPTRMRPAESRNVVDSQGSSKGPKRMVMDCVLLERPPKRKDRAVERVVAVEISRPRVSTEVCITLTSFALWSQSL